MAQKRTHDAAVGLIQLTDYSYWCTYCGVKIAHSSNRARHSDGRKHKRRVEAGNHCTVPPDGPQPRQREGYDMDQPSVNDEGGAGAGLPVEQTRSPSPDVGAPHDVPIDPTVQGAVGHGVSASGDVDPQLGALDLEAWGDGAGADGDTEDEGLGQESVCTTCLPAAALRVGCAGGRYEHVRYSQTLPAGA